LEGEREVIKQHRKLFTFTTESQRGIAATKVNSQ